MKATGALPTEKRVQLMNDQQWLWCYLNVIEDEKDEEEKWKTRLDYLGWYINEDKFQSVADIKKEKKPNNDEEDGQQYDEKPVSVNDSFEEEMKRVLADSGANINEFTELPDSNMVGDPNESKDDFITRVLNNQHLSFNNIPIGIENVEEFKKTNNPIDESSLKDLKDMGIDPDDIDYFDE